MVDFDGKIACTVFTGGCNFRCPFCHNAPLVVGNLNSQRIDEAEVFDYLQKRKGLVDAVCVTGGEPTLQPDLCDFLTKVRGMGYATKLDTNGLRPDVLEEVLNKKLVDFVAMDVKNSPEKYALTVGVESVDMGKILKSMQLLKGSGVDYEFRTTIIKEFHTAEDMQKNCLSHLGRTSLFHAKIQRQRRLHRPRLHPRRQSHCGKLQDLFCRESWARFPSRL